MVGTDQGNVKCCDAPSVGGIGFGMDLEGVGAGRLIVDKSDCPGGLFG